jgi:hypothetical protein
MGRENAMAIFTVIATENADKLAERLQKELPDDYINVIPGVWLVAFNNISSKLAERLHLAPNEPIATALVMNNNAFAGIADSEVAEFIRMKSQHG